MESLEIKSQTQDGHQTSEHSLCVAFGIIVLRRLITGLAFLNQRCNTFRPVTTELKPQEVSTEGTLHVVIGNIQSKYDQGQGSWETECISEE